MLIFREVQYASCWALLVLSLVGLVLPVFFVALSRLIGRQDGGFAAYGLLGAAGVLFLTASSLFVLFGHLTTEVDAVQVRASFGWLNVYSRTVPLSEVCEAKVVRYRPMDYGGWGARGTDRDQIISQKGERGVKLQLADGTTLLLGSQKPEELATAINTARDRMRAE